MTPLAIRTAPAIRTAIVSALALGLAAAPAFAQSAGDWTLGLGLHRVAPKSDNGALAGGTLPVDVGASARPTVTFEYFLRDNLGIELLAALPFSHDVEIAGLGKVGSTKHLPPVLSLQYHFANGSALTPFAGIGVNYTGFFGESTTGALAGSDLRLKASWGLAARLGVDFRLSERGALRFDVRWIDIDSDVILDGNKIGTVNIDPWVVGAGYVLRF